VPRASEFGSRPAEIIDVPISLRGQPGLVLRVDKNKVTRHWATTADEDFYAAMNEVVMGWDLVNDDGSPYELTVSNWLELKLTLADEMGLVEQLVQACVPSRAEGNALGEHSSVPLGGSQPLTTSQNSGATSPLETVSESPSPT
jgi:hypothetical protein